ncbi:MAG: hypothetical protein WC962_09315, partial [Phycisphaerae bacterium]
IPDGIGEEKTITDPKTGKAQVILIDPMTKEVISATPATDESGRERMDNRGRKIYQDNDYWFILKFKLRWNDGPNS